MQLKPVPALHFHEGGVTLVPLSRERKVRLEMVRDRARSEAARPQLIPASNVKRH